MTSTATSRALLFDLDGTLVDTAELNLRCYQDSLGEVGVVLGREAFSAHLGGHWRTFLPLLCGSDDPELLGRVHRRKQELYAQRLGALRANEPLVALLRQARPAFRTGLVTSASRAAVLPLLRHFGWEGAFDAVITGDDVVAAKPDPEGYLRCLRELGCLAGHSLACEDAPAGMAAARAAGLMVLCVQGFTAAGATRS